MLLDLVFTVVPALRVANSVDGDGSHADLTTTNDKFTLATTNWHHDVDWLEIGHHGLVDRTTAKDTGRLQGGTTTFDSVNGALAVDGVTQGIDNTAEESRTNGNIDDLAGTFTVSPSLMRRSLPKMETPTLSASKSRHMP